MKSAIEVSRFVPLTDAVDFMRGVYFRGDAKAQQDILHLLGYNLVIMAVMFVVFLVVGTWLFVKKEKER